MRIVSSSISKFRNNNPDKGTETIEIIEENIVKVKFRNNNPDKGTETFSKRGRICFRLFTFRNNNPDKGTETAAAIIAHLTICLFRNNNPDKGTETIIITSNIYIPIV